MPKIIDFPYCMPPWGERTSKSMNHIHLAWFTEMILLAWASRWEQGKLT